MDQSKNIFNNVGKAAFDVPEGYFESLRGRLEAIPAGNGPGTGAMGRITPYLALAACFVAIMLVGNLVLRSTAGDDIMTDYYSRIAYSDLSRTTFSTARPPNRTKSPKKT